VEGEEIQRGEDVEETKEVLTVSRVLRVGAEVFERLDLPRRLIPIGVAADKLDLEALEETVELNVRLRRDVAGAHIAEVDVSRVGLEELEDDLGKLARLDHGLTLR
jgi:hypothetical protein